MSRRGLPLAFVLAAATFDPLTSPSLSKGGAVFLVALAGAALSLWAGRIEAQVLGFTALLGWLGASLFWSAHPNPVALVPWLTLPLVVLAGAGRTAEARHEHARTFASATLLFTGVLALGQWLTKRPVDGGHGNSNALGLVVAVCLPLSLDWATSRFRAPGTSGRVKQAERALIVLGLGVAAFALFQSQSRTAWVALSVVVIAHTRGKYRLLLAPLAILLGYAFVRGDLANAAGGRLFIARVGLRAAVDAAPLGVGVGAFPFAFLEAQARLLEPVGAVQASRLFLNAVMPHGDWLGLLVTGGVVGLGLGVWVAFACARRVRGATAETATLLCVAVAALGDDVLVLPAVGVCVGLVVTGGLMEPSRPADIAPSGKPGSIGAFFSRSLLVALVVGAAAVGPFLVRRYASQRAVHTAERATDDPETHRRDLARARRLDPSDGEAAFLSGTARLEEGELLSALEELKASELHFANVGTRIAIGNAELLLGHHRAAVDAYREAARLDPGSFRAHANLVEALRLLGRLDAAEAELALARSLKPHHSKLERMAVQLARARMDAASTEPPSTLP